MKEERYLVTGSMDQELRVWRLHWTGDVKEEDKLARHLEIVKLEETDNLEDSSVSNKAIKTVILIIKLNFTTCRLKIDRNRFVMISYCTLC